MLAGLNVAVQVAALLREILVVAEVPEQLPDHAMNTDPDWATAFNAMLLPTVYRWLQSLPHEIPLGLEVTVPLPAPDLLTLSFA
ncbi:MAG: hypothetical protein JNN20_06950 [Betaproteobacteria bacterium]|nr:hypothetical protein [Betaproteobacteria bacterium]